MNKRLKKLSLVFILLFALMPFGVFANGDVKLWIDGNYIKSDVAPVIENDRTLVPLRVISENLGYNVDWNPETKEVTITKLKEGTTDVFTVIGFTVGNSKLNTFDMKSIGNDAGGAYFEVLTESVSKDLDAAPKIFKDRTLVPIRAIAENLGRNVVWDNANRTVVIGDGYATKTVTPAPTTNTFKEATVTRVVDGDTIVVDMQGQSYKVRLIGVNTPETKHPRKGVEYFGKEASDYTTRELTGKTVYLQKDVSDTDKYGRLLAYVWLTRPATDNPTNDEITKYMFNSKLVENGYANASTYAPDIKYQEIFRSRENIARENKYGLWGDGGQKVVETPNPVNTNNKINGNVSGKKEFKDYSTPIAGSYVGNSNSHKFHRSSCPSAKKTAPHNRVPFSSRGEAINAGYVPCKRCNP